MPRKMARSAPRPPFGLPEMAVAVRIALSPCKEPGIPRISKPVRESSGESRLEPGERLRHRREVQKPDDEQAIAWATNFYNDIATDVRLERFVLYDGKRVVLEHVGPKR